jgi:hypothetical protein
MVRLNSTHFGYISSKIVIKASEDIPSRVKGFSSLDPSRSVLVHWGRENISLKIGECSTKYSLGTLKSIFSTWGY